MRGRKQQTFYMKEIRVVYKTPQFDAFYASLPVKVQTKFKYVIDVITTIYDVSTKFVKHLENTDLYEMRVSVGNNEYRTILFAVDKSNIIESTKIVLLNGFLKKSTKEYRKQIELAQSILKKLPTFNQQLNDECGRQGTPARDEFHEEALSWYYGQILRSRRQELKMTQKQLADKLGREQSYIARVERGKVDVQLSSFLRIAAALGIQFVPTVANALR